MGKADGYLTVGRLTASRQEVDERLKHYGEIYRHLTDSELRQQASRCMSCGTPFCHGSGCPLGNIIPEWNDLVYRGRWREAAEILHSTSNFPEITGRVCPALCEAACVGACGGDAVTVRQIELAVIEKAFAEAWIQPRPPLEETGKTVGIVGSGPAGLAAAQQLRRAGHEVVVFEKEKKPGGLLRYGIPNFKLEKWVLDRRIEQLVAEGVQFHCEVEAGNDVSSGYLLKKCDAVCLTCGAGQPRDINIPGRDAHGIHFALEFLSQQARRNMDEPLRQGEKPLLATGKKVLIIGGGDTGADCLGTALRQKALSVRQLEIMPRPPEGYNEETPWPLWPQILRTSAAHEEGGERAWSVNTSKFIVDGGHVSGIACVEVEWKKDAKTGRMNFSPVPGSEFEVEADLVLLAMGFVHPVHSGLLDSFGLEYDARGNIRIDDGTMMTSVERVFAAGDAASGAWLVVGAIAAGRRMARQVDLFLMGESSLPDTPPLPKLHI
jgi:glutamate synthase (NADPH/NADH) small chain